MSKKKWKIAALLALSCLVMSPVLAFDAGDVARLVETRSCPGGDLRGATLKNKDLTGADLTGADLSYADLSGAHCLHRDRCKFTDAHAGAADDLDDHGKAEVAILFCNCDEFFVFGARHLFFLRIDVVWLCLEDRDETVVPACVSEEAV